MNQVPGSRLVALIFVLPLLVVYTGCNDDHLDDDHDELSRVTIEIRATGQQIAEWQPGTGWDVDELLPLPADAGGSQALWADGPNASLNVRMFDDHGDEFEMATISRDDVTGVRQCTEFSAQYTVATGASQDVIAWPPLIEGGEVSQFALRKDGSRVGIFHCNHVHVYPEEAGETRIQFQLWHINHPDEATDPILVRVLPPQD